MMKNGLSLKEYNKTVDLFKFLQTNCSTADHNLWVAAQIHIFFIWDSHNGGYEEYYLLEYNAM
jgi:hypothetical protein